MPAQITESETETGVRQMQLDLLDQERYRDAKALEKLLGVPLDRDLMLQRSREAFVSGDLRKAKNYAWCCHNDSQGFGNDYALYSEVDLRGINTDEVLDRYLEQDKQRQIGIGLDFLAEAHFILSDAEEEGRADSSDPSLWLKHKAFRVVLDQFRSGNVNYGSINTFAGHVKYMADKFKTGVPGGIVNRAYEFVLEDDEQRSVEEAHCKDETIFATAIRVFKQEDLGQPTHALLDRYYQHLYNLAFTEGGEELCVGSMEKVSNLTKVRPNPAFIQELGELVQRKGKGNLVDDLESTSGYEVEIQKPSPEILDRQCEKLIEAGEVRRAFDYAGWNRIEELSPGMIKRVFANAMLNGEFDTAYEIERLFIERMPGTKLEHGKKLTLCLPGQKTGKE